MPKNGWRAEKAERVSGCSFLGGALEPCHLFPTRGLWHDEKIKEGDQWSHLCGINHCMLRQSEAETEACGRRSSSVVVAGEIGGRRCQQLPLALNGGAPPCRSGETKGARSRSCGAFTETTAATTAFPSLPRPAGCEIVEDPAAYRRPPRGRACQGYERIVRAQHARWGAPRLHTPSHAPRAHEWLDSGDWPRPSR